MSIKFNKHLGSWVQKHHQPTAYRSARVEEPSLGEYAEYKEDHQSGSRSHRSHRSQKSHQSQSNRLLHPSHRSKLNRFKNVGKFHPSGVIYRWTILILASNLLLAAYFADESIPATVTYLKKDYNINSQQVAMLYSASFVPNLLMTIVGGILVDKYGTNKTSMLYSTFVLFGIAIFAFSPSYYGKLVGRVVFGLGFEPLEIAQDVIMTRWYWDESINTSPSLTFSYGFTFATSQLGQLIGSNVLPTLGAYGLFWCYGMSVVMCLFGTVSNIILVFLDYRAAPVLNLDDMEEDEEEFSLKALKELPFKFWMFCFITVFSYTTILVFMAFSTDFIHTKYDISVGTAGHINSTVYGMSILLSPLLGWFLNKYGYLIVVLATGILSLIAGLLLLGLTTVHPYVGLALIGVSYAFIPNAIWPSISLVCGDAVAGTAFGGVTGLNSVGLLLMPYFMGWLHDHFGNYMPVCVACAGFAAFGLLLTCFLGVLDFMDGGWINAGKPNPRLAEQSEKIPLIVNKD